jgi:hypothetical protein
MNGHVDERNRALLTIEISKSANGPSHKLLAGRKLSINYETKEVCLE